MSNYLLIKRIKSISLSNYPVGNFFVENFGLEKKKNVILF